MNRVVVPRGVARALSGLFLVSLTGAAASTTGCDARPSGLEQAQRATPTYNPNTGKLERLTADVNRDGVPDVRADMDGLAVSRIEIDRTGDGRPDRWEYYAAAQPGDRTGGSGATLVRAEEARGASGRITRREIYVGGRLTRVEEDGDDDGQTDKWETYADGAIVMMELDLTGRGRPDQRLRYLTGGRVLVEVDPDLDGVFVPRPAASGPEKSSGGRGGR